MKKVKLLFLFAMLFTINGVLSSCDSSEDDNDYIIDWAPVSFFIEVRDKAGNDLLDPDAENNILAETTITYKGETYEVSRDNYDKFLDYLQNTATRAYAAHMYGVQLMNKNLFNRDDLSNDFYLEFGEIDGALDMEEDFVITWPDKSKNVIHYHCSDHKYGKNPDCKRYFMLDGVKTETNVFKFVK